MRVMQSVFVFSKFERPSAVFEILVPERIPMQSRESVFDSLRRLFPILFFVRLRQDKMNRRNFVAKHKAAHRWQVFVLKSARPPPTAIRAKAKLTSKIRDYSGDVPTAR
jgi:hypothetical protein